jgi:hypothetical protein
MFRSRRILDDDEIVDTKGAGLNFVFLCNLTLKFEFVLCHLTTDPWTPCNWIHGFVEDPWTPCNWIHGFVDAPWIRNTGPPRRRGLLVGAQGRHWPWLRGTDHDALRPVTVTECHPRHRRCQ